MLPTLHSHIATFKNRIQALNTTWKDDKEMMWFSSPLKLIFSDPNCTKDWEKTTFNFSQLKAFFFSKNQTQGNWKKTLETEEANQ